MARYTGPVCRLCRREGEKLFLKGDRCFSTKCAIDRREGVPGQHAKGRGRFSEYKVQLREKQKIKRMYGLLERQFRNTFHKADQLRGVTGEQLLVLLETRLDNITTKAGFASSRPEGRQLVRHGHITVNGERISIPSYIVKAGDVIALREKSKELPRAAEALKSASARQFPEWMEVDVEGKKATIKALPTRAQITHPMKEQLVVELYSK